MYAIRFGNGEFYRLRSDPHTPDINSAKLTINYKPAQQWVDIFNKYLQNGPITDRYNPEPYWPMDRHASPDEFPFYAGAHVVRVNLTVEELL